jgi:hypothetical protein
MNPLENAISNSKNKPILKPPHDTMLGLNQIEIFKNKLSKPEINYLCNNLKKNFKIKEGATLKDILVELNKTPYGTPVFGYIDSKEIMQLIHK